MEYTNSIGDYNILTDFELTKNLIIVEMIDFFTVYKYKDSKIMQSEHQNESSALVAVKVIKQGKDCSIFKEGDTALIDVVMLSQFYYIFERYHTIDPKLMIAPEHLFLAKIED